MRKITGALFALVAATSLAPLHPAGAATKYSAALHGDDNIEQIHDQAVEALVRGRSTEALRGFNEVLRAQPFNAKAYYNRATVYYLRREFDLALQDYTAALKHRPGFAAAMMNRGIVYSNLDRLDEALLDLDKAAELDPANPNVVFNRAVVHVKRGDLKDAIADYERIVQLDGAYKGLGGAKQRLSGLITRIEGDRLNGRERAWRIVAEIDHARTIEKLLNFADRTCISLGDDRSALTALAESDGWKKASARKLAKVSTPTLEVTDGWTVTNLLGDVAVVLTRSVNAPEQTSCSISVRLGDAHWFGDLAMLFTDRFQSPALTIREVENRRIGEQVVTRADQAKIVVVLSQTSSQFFTLRTVHGRRD